MRQTLTMLTNSENTTDLMVLNDLIDSEAVAPGHRQHLAAERDPAAIQYMIDGHAAARSS
ncbi:hypothetical protein BJF90_34825 [Pseudonocardia sp. CNS-004]|nr:hypothetical protein BJF90_34825 [Pseudonocardia sp. CNS-004]